MQHGSYVNNLPDTDMNEPHDNIAEDEASGDEEDGQQLPSHGDATAAHPRHHPLSTQVFNTFNSPCLKTRDGMTSTRNAKAEAVAAIIVKAQRATLASVYTLAF
jgi:hypothetical protein